MGSFHVIMYFLISNPSCYSNIFSSKVFLITAVPDPYKFNLFHILKIRSDLIKEAGILLLFNTAAGYHPEFITVININRGSLLLVDINAVVYIAGVNSQLNKLFQFGSRTTNHITT